MVQPLDGVKVLDFSQVILGPVCSRLLAEAGADVIKVETLEGDISRLTEHYRGDSTIFMQSNRGKRSLAINLKDPKGLEVILKLAKDTDVLVQNFRPGVMEKMGLGYEAIRKINPGVIYTSLYMYGDTGPLAHRRGGDPWAQAFTGMVASQGEPGKAPYMNPHGIIDRAGALIAAYGVVTALFMRQQTGVGQELTTNLVNAGAFLQEAAICSYLQDGILYTKGGRGRYNGNFPYGAYLAKDGDVVTIFGQDDDEWVILCDILGLNHLLGDPRYDSAAKRKERRFELYPIMDEAFRQKTRDEWAQAFKERGLRCDPCLNYAEFAAHPQFEANDLLLEVDHTREGKLRMLGNPLKLKGCPPMSGLRAAPVLGEHSREILMELGYSEEETNRMAEQGIIGIPTSDMLEGDRVKVTLDSISAAKHWKRRGAK